MIIQRIAEQLYQRMSGRGSGVIVNVIGVAGERHRPDYIAGTSGNAALGDIARARCLNSGMITP